FASITTSRAGKLDSVSAAGGDFSRAGASAAPPASSCPESLPQPDARRAVIRAIKYTCSFFLIANSDYVSAMLKGNLHVMSVCVQNQSLRRDFSQGQAHERLRNSNGRCEESRSTAFGGLWFRI